MSAIRFPDTPRVDAHDKVRGEAIFGGGRLPAGDRLTPRSRSRRWARVASPPRHRRAQAPLPAFAGPDAPDARRARSSRASSSPGVSGSRASSRCSSPAVAYRGQPIALVAADTLEAAIEAASLVIATYEHEAFNVLPDHARPQTSSTRPIPPAPGHLYSPDVPETPTRPSPRLRSRSMRSSPARLSTRIRWSFSARSPSGGREP